MGRATGHSLALLLATAAAWLSLGCSLVLQDPCPGQKVNVTTFFSPDHSVNPYVAAISSAQRSIDMYISDLQSWTGCSPSDAECVGCSISQMARESSPIFSALINACRANNSVNIRILVGQAQEETCEDAATPLDWLMMNLVQVGHSKIPIGAHFLQIDSGKKIMLTSMHTNSAPFLYNRESSVILESECNPMSQFLSEMFDLAWCNAIPHTLQVYNATETAKMTPSCERNITSLEQPLWILQQLGAYVTSVSTEEAEVTKVMVGPDSVRDELLRTIASVESSLLLAVPSITDLGLCKAILDLSRRLGRSVSVMVSHTLVDEDEAKLSEHCLRKLYYGGMSGEIWRSPLLDQNMPYYSHAGQAYMIVDMTDVYFMTGTFSQEDLVDGAINTYIGLRSRKLATTVFTVFNEDTSRQYADRYDPGDVAWGPEKSVPVPPPSPIYIGDCRPPPEPKLKGQEYGQLTLAGILETMGTQCVFYRQ